MTSPAPRLLRPNPDLSGLIFLAVACEDPAGGLNFFPASALCAVTFVRAGRLHLVGEDGARAALPKAFVSGPLSRPLVSCAEPGTRAMSVAFYPDAWRRVTGVPARTLRERHVAIEAALPGPAVAALGLALSGADFDAGFSGMQRGLAPLWRARRPAPASLARWLDALRAAGAGLGARQAQRRLREATGQSLRELRAHARLERLRALAGEGGDLADIAARAGYADQSHMGRELKRLVGETPARMRSRVAADPRFWFYRLMEQVDEVS